MRVVGFHRRSASSVMQADDVAEPPRVRWRLVNGDATHVRPFRWVSGSWGQPEAESAIFRTSGGRGLLAARGEPSGGATAPASSRPDDARLRPPNRPLLLTLPDRAACIHHKASVKCQLRAEVGT